MSRCGMLWRVCVVALAPAALCYPELLSCDSDTTTRMRVGQMVMSKAVIKAKDSETFKVEVFRSSGTLTSFTPGEKLAVHISGLSKGTLYAVRVSDSGGRLEPASSVHAENKCDGQVYSTKPAAEDAETEIVFLETSCNAHAAITVTAVYTNSISEPCKLQQVSVSKGSGLDPSCSHPTPKPTPPPKPYPPFPAFSAGPNGDVAEYGLPCPKKYDDNEHPPGLPDLRVISPDGKRPKYDMCPIHAEVKGLELLTDKVTPSKKHYIANNGKVPERAWSRDLTGWELLIDGEVNAPRKFTMDKLKALPKVTRQYVLECGGNGAHGYMPNSVTTPSWTQGGVGCATWTGVLLSDVLREVGLKSQAVYIGYYGEDTVCGSSTGVPISRGIPIEKALDNHTMLAWAMNGEPLPANHGFPLRMLAPGFPGSAQGKWLKRLWIRDRVHDGPQMGGKFFRVPMYPLRPGDLNAPDSDFKILTQMPVKSIITHPPRCTVTKDQTVLVEGKAWSGAGKVTRVEVSYDNGLTWAEASLLEPTNKYAWQSWSVTVKLPSRGVWFIFARATDHTGATQPLLVPPWNPGGYANNQAMKVDVEVEPEKKAERKAWFLTGGAAPWSHSGKFDASKPLHLGDAPSWAWSVNANNFMAGLATGLASAAIGATISRRVHRVSVTVPAVIKRDYDHME